MVWSISMSKITLWLGVRVDDWTAKLAIIAIISSHVCLCVTHIFLSSGGGSTSGHIWIVSFLNRCIFYSIKNSIWNTVKNIHTEIWNNAPADSVVSRKTVAKNNIEFNMLLMCYLSPARKKKFVVHVTETNLLTYLRCWYFHALNALLPFLQKGKRIRAISTDKRMRPIVVMNRFEVTHLN